MEQPPVNTRYKGSHRQEDNRKQRRLATTLLSATALSTGGVLVSEATAQNTQPEVTPVTLASQATLLAQDAEFAEEAPRIVEVPQVKDVANIANQLDKALAFDAIRMALDAASRLPQYFRPAEGQLTSLFGSRWGTHHNGIDIAGEHESAILAIQDAIVLDAGPASGFGQWIRLLLEDGTMLVYGHMNSLDVHPGDRVSAGQRIAGMGNQGFSTGTHLHFEVHPAGSGPIDPLPWLEERGISY